MSGRWGLVDNLSSWSKMFTFVNEKCREESMDVGLSGELELLSSQVVQLVERHDALRRREHELTERIRTLEAELAQAHDALATVRSAETIQSAAVAFGPGSKDAQQARKIISQLVREIDNCIALLRI